MDIARHEGTLTRRRNALGRFIGRRVRAEREGRGLRVADIAQITGRSEQEVRRLELGYHEPTLRTVYRVASALAIDPRTLLPPVK